jgi:hypothetical protein
MKKRKTTQRDKGTKGQREPQSGVFPFFAPFVPLSLCVEKAFVARIGAGNYTSIWFDTSETL